jgi:signal peptidase I/TM2 domain-containing membrane protein YozV
MRDDDDTTGRRRPPERELEPEPERSRDRSRSAESVDTPPRPRAASPARRNYVGRRTRRPGGFPKRSSPSAGRGPVESKRSPDVEPDTDYSKRPKADAYEEGPSPLVAALLALAFSGLGQLYNGRLARAVFSVVLPLGLLLAAVVTGSATVYLMAFVSGALTAPSAVTLLAVGAGWVHLGHPALWLGLPIKIVMVAEAALDAYQTRRRNQHRVRSHRKWVRVVYLASMGLIVLVWMFTTGTATVRQPGMNPILEPGDHVVVDRLAWGLQVPLIGVRIGGSPIRRGERVAVLDPDGSGRLLIRRVFAVAGDRVDFGPPAGPLAIRQPMLSRSGGVVTPVLWLRWRGPCVFALEAKLRKKETNYARCRAFLEHHGGRSFVVSYPITHGPHRGAPYKRGKVGRGKVYLLSDNRGVVRDGRHWGPVSTRRIRGRPSIVLWSSDPLEGIRWHRMGLKIQDLP